MNIVHAKELFVQKMNSKNWSKATIKNYLSQVELFLSCFIERDRPRNITAQEIELYLLNKVNINSRNHSRCAINAFYKMVVNQPNKLKFIPYPKKESKLIEYITSEEAASILSVCHNLKHKSIICLAYGCGLRISEILSLKPCDIDSKKMIINVIQGKGKKDRQVMLPFELLELLRIYWKEFKHCGMYLFKGQTEDRYSERSINLFLKKYAFMANIKKNVHCHLFRHGFASSSIEIGTDIRIIQKLLGHNSIKTTLKYTHISTNLISRTPSPLSSIYI